MAAARRLVAKGRGLEVTPAQPYAPWYRQSAQNVVSKAAILSYLLEADDGAPTIAVLRTPLLAFFGAQERGSEATLATIRRQVHAVPVDTQVVADADHMYLGHEADVAALIARWAAPLA